MPVKEQIPDLRYNSTENSPCIKERLLSLECLKEHKYNKTQCSEYFENYNNCRKFWSNVCNERRSKRITPLLPPPEDREKIKKEYLEFQKND